MNNILDTDDFDLHLYELDIDANNLEDFDLKFDGDIEEIDNRHVKPRLLLHKNSFVKYDNAIDLAKEIYIDKNERVDCIISGNFIFGEFIGAYLQEYDILVPEMTINTLSLGEDNILMLADLLENGYIKKLNLVVSYYFYQHNRRTLIPKIYELLDSDNNNFQLAVCGTHMKCTTFTTSDGKKIVIHGSANMRSSANIEHFTIEENEQLFDFYNNVHQIIINDYSTINHALRCNKLHKAIGIELHKERKRKGGV